MSLASGPRERARCVGDHIPRQGSGDKKAAEGFYECVLSVTQEKGFVGKRVTNTDETGLSLRDAGEQTYTTPMVFEK